MRSSVLLATTLLMMAGMVTVAFAASLGADTPNSLAGAPQWRYHLDGTADHVRITGADIDADDNETVVTVVIDPGYHINANPASLEYLIPTTLNVTNKKPLRVIYPRGIRFKPKFADQALDVYEGTVRIIAEFSHGSLTRDPHLFGTLTAQACTEEICLPPADLPLPNR